MEALLRARKLEYDYNHCPIPDNVPMEVIHKGNQDKLVAILGRVGARARVARPFTCTFGCNVSIGDDSLTMHKYTHQNPSGAMSD